MSARRKPARRQKRETLERPPALPFVQASPSLMEEHARLTAEGYTLAERLFVRVDRRRWKAKVEVRWTRREPEIGPKAHRTMSHYFDIDLRKAMEKRREAAA